MEQHPQDIQPTFTPEAAVNYLDAVRGLYRNNEADYRGHRSTEQKEIAANAAEEADRYFDGMILGVAALATNNHGEDALINAIPSTEEERTTTLGYAQNPVSLYEMRGGWRQAWTAMAVMTNRLARDSARFNSRDLKEVNKLPEADRAVLMQTMFGQFQDINKLRFGVSGFGLSRTRRIHNDEGGIDEVKYDPDAARHEREVSSNAARRRYTVKGHTAYDNENEGNAVHTVGKLSPDELIELRKEFPELDADDFFHATGYRKNAISALRGKK